MYSFQVKTLAIYLYLALGIRDALTTTVTEWEELVRERRQITFAFFNGNWTLRGEGGGQTP